MKKTVSLKVAAVIACFAVLGLVGCSKLPADTDKYSIKGSDSDGSGYELRESSIILEDGRKITCVTYDGTGTSNSVGVSCDWVSANETKNRR